MRIAITAYYHESNTFAPVPATLDQWRTAGILEGDAVSAEHETARTIVSGYLAYGASDPDIETVPLVYSALTPMGMITAEAYEHLTDRMIRALHDSGPWDAVLLPLHGAGVSAEHIDADGEFIRRVRNLVGPDVPIGVTLDMHANLSSLMVDQADVITVYQTNPHVDAYEQGLAAAELIGRQVRGEINPTMALATPPLAVDILRQGTDDEPMAGLLAMAKTLMARPGVLSVSIVEGFPYADVPEMGMSFLAVTDGDQPLAQQVAETAATAAWERRTDLVGDAHSIDDGLHLADAATETPVILMDVGDNVGGGSPGDSTHVLHAARRLGVRGVAQMLCDPAAVRECQAAGVGNQVQLEVGGKTDQQHGSPLPITATIAAITDGKIDDRTPTHGGMRYFELGPTARLTTDDGFDLVVTSRPEGTRSQGIFSHVGIDPAKARIIVAKGVHSPRAAFEPIAAQMIWLATPGSTSADLSTLSYRHRRRPMFPFEPDASWDT